MMKTSLMVAVVFLAVADHDFAAAPETTSNVFESSAPLTPANEIDRIVFARLSSLGIRPALCSDAVFVRRAYLDVIGTLPTAQEARAFIQDPDVKNKRRVLIDRLLERDEFADYWAMKWGDILRIKAEFPVNLWPNAAQAYHRWVRSSIAENKPYDKFVREMLTSSGSNFRVGPVNFYRAIQNRTPEGIATAVALSFMGARTEAWPKERLPGMAVFFAQIGYKPTSEWKEENVFWDPVHACTLVTNTAPGQAAIVMPASPASSTSTSAAKPSAAKPSATKSSPTKPPVANPSAAKSSATKSSATKPPVTNPSVAKSSATKRPAAKSPTAIEAPPEITPPAAPELPTARAPLAAIFPDGTRIRLSPNRDPREVFADWLITPKNPWFTRSIANRVWAWLLGRGIIHEPDDIRDNNPPSNPELLAYLEQELVASNYDLKRLYRLILNSNTYQFSSMPRFNTPQAEACFASYPLRRLDAEVLIDAINRIAGASDLYTSPIPEPFTYIPQDMPAIAIADGSITSPFLTLFGRSARATGMENERVNKPVPSQWLHMLNSSHIQRKLDQGPKLKAIFESGRKPAEIVEELYLTILSRPPTADEVRSAEEYGMVPAPGKPVKASNQPGKVAGKPGKSPDQAGKVAGQPVKVSNQPGKAAGKPGKTPDQPGKVAGKNGTAAKPGKASKPIVVKRRDDWVDITWALINSTEFLYRH